MEHKFTSVNHLKDYSIRLEKVEVLALCHACECESNQQEHVARQLQSRGSVWVCVCVCVCVWHLIFTGTIQLTAVTLPHTNTETTHNYGCQSRFLLRFP